MRLDLEFLEERLHDRQPGAEDCLALRLEPLCAQSIGGTSPQGHRLDLGKALAGDRVMTEFGLSRPATSDLAVPEVPTA